MKPQLNQQQIFKLKPFLAAALFMLLSVMGVSCFGSSEKTLKTEHFSFIYTSTDEQAIKRLAVTLESAYTRVSQSLKTVPSKNLEVYIYRHRWQYIRATGNWGASGSIEGPAKIHFLEQDWSRKENERVAIHEFTHAVVLKLLIDREAQPLDVKKFDKKFSSFPVWLWEAVSNYEAGELIDPRKFDYLKNGSYPSLSELGDRLKGAKIYDVGYTILEYILKQYGREKLLELIGNYGNVQGVLHVTADEFSRNWYSFLKDKYLK